ncbi:TIGR04255 family protein [Vibrio splendidus]|uniref:TIGR04255 family protein n=1 Tax=Vibrio splendidus TaxID=29497 RepID=A0AA43JVH0_VIBSP|nr:TIGR04255 family protein [Vibrio splendidus]MDH5921077.1 TIGR04255 family protein [Vibrio splendidus]
MPFEQKPRVRFHNDPLVEVVCQFVFVSEVEDFRSGSAEKLVQLHDSIKDKLPLFKRSKNVSLDVNTDTQSVSQVEAPVYEFSSIDETVRVVVSPDSVAFVTTKYESKEVFFDYIFSVYDALLHLGMVLPIKRIGLRYKDVIQRSRLAENGESLQWNELLKSSLVSILEEEELTKTQILGAHSNFTIALDSINKNAKVNVNCGIVNHAQSHEQCFMIDSDYFIEGIFDYDSASDFLHRANVKARDFFQWCITDKLYEALRPERIEP